MKKILILGSLILLSSVLIAQPSAPKQTKADSVDVVSIPVKLEDSEVLKMKSFEDGFKRLQEQGKELEIAYTWFRNTLIETRAKITLAPSDTVTFEKDKFVVKRVTPKPKIKP